MHRMHLIAVCAIFPTAVLGSPITPQFLADHALLQEAVQAETAESLFAGCGTLQRGPQTCFILIADTGESLLIENHEGFGDGDRVYVTGSVVENSLICWPFVDDALENNTIQECYEGCGVLGRGPQSCTLFLGDDGRAFALDEYGEFFVGDRVYVSGPVLDDSLDCWPAMVDKIEHNSIQECFDGCGTIGRGPQSCHIFAADDGRGFLINGTGGFELGDHVRIIGPITEQSEICWPIIGPAIENATIEACAD